MFYSLSDSRRVSVPRPSRAAQIRPSDSFNVFLFSPSSSLIQELLVLTCTVPDSLAKDIKRTHAPTLPNTHTHIHTHSRTHSDVDSFVIYRQYLRDDKDNSVCAPPRDFKVNSSQ